jgi:hypothetical protein
MEVGMKYFLIIPLALMLAACEKEGALERAGEEVDEAVEDVQNGEETTANKIDDTIDEATE